MTDFVPVAVIYLWGQRTKLRSRKSDFELYDGALYQDTLIIYQPDTYILENPPEKLLLESDFGSYSREVLVTDTSISVIRQFVTREGKWGASRYSDFYDFREKIHRYDLQKLVFRKVE